jgi:hypothetical protein
LRLQELFEINGGDSTEDVQKRRSALSKMNLLKKQHLKGKFHLDPNTTEVCIPTDRQTRYKTEHVFEIRMANKTVICCAEDARSREEWFQGIITSMSRSPQELLRNRTNKMRVSSITIDKKRDSQSSRRKDATQATDTDNSQHSSSSDNKSSSSQLKTTEFVGGIFLEETPRLEHEEKSDQ